MARPSTFSVVKAETFGPAGEEEVPEILWRRINRTIWAGSAIAIVFAVGLVTWAAVSPVAGSVNAQGVVKVENNRKTIKHLEPGILRDIRVHEGDTVKQGQLLFVFDDAQPKAQAAELQNTYDTLLAERARFEAEAANRPDVTFPPELTARQGVPEVAAALTAERALFTARRAALQSQIEIGRQRIQEIDQQIVGLKAQMAAVDQQIALNKDEMQGVQTLYAGGYAPKTRLLNLQRSEASLEGQRGQAVSEIARAEQSIGETRTQVLSSQQARVSEAAAGLQADQDKIADTAARLAAAKDALEHTRVVAPVDGTVLNLTQFTVGGVTGVGEPLMDIVPTGEPLIIEAKILPKDAHAVQPGQKAMVTLSAYNTRTTPRVFATVINLSADQTVDPHTGKPYFTAQLRLPPDQLKRLPPTVKIYPGMPVSASIVNGERTVLSYIFKPITDIFAQSMHEQ